MARINVGGTSLRLGIAAGLTVAVGKVQLSQARKERNKRKKVLQAASTVQARKDGQHAYVASQKVRFATMIEAVRRLPFDERPTFAECLQWSQELKLHLPINELTRLRLKAKAGGGYRYYLDFDPRHRTAQRIVADMLAVQFKPKHYQYGARKSGGVKAAIEKTRTLITNGFIHVRRLDIKKYFDNFSHAAMLSPALPISNKITEHVVIGRHFSIQVDTKLKHGSLAPIALDYVNLIGHTGIPQGSAVSPLIGEFFMSKLGVNMPVGTRLINYVDDFLILAKTPGALVQAESALKSALAGLSVGTFELLEKSSSSSPSLPGSVTQFEFLGHLLRLDDGKLAPIRVNDANIFKVEAELDERVNHLTTEMKKWNGHKAYKEAAHHGVLEMARYICSWRNTFSAADDNDYGADAVAVTLEAYLIVIIEQYPFLDLETIINEASKSPGAEIEVY